MINYRGGGTGSSGGYYRQPRSRVSLSIATIFSLAILFLGKIGNPVVEHARIAATDFLVPIAEAIVAPVSWSEGFSTWVGSVVDIFDENTRLREENARLMEWRSIAEGLDIENARLRGALKAPLQVVDFLVTARVIAVQGGPYVRTVLIDAGADQGVTEGLPVITPEGIVGRIISVGRSASRVLLITDFNSRVPVIVERSSQNAIAVGSNSQLLELGFLPVDMDVQIGDRILSSGHGGVYPPDIPVGEIVAINGDSISLNPAAKLGSLDFVRVLDYDTRRREPGAEPSVPEEAAETGESDGEGA